MLLTGYYGNYYASITRGIHGSGLTILNPSGSQVNFITIPAATK